MDLKKTLGFHLEHLCFQFLKEIVYETQFKQKVNQNKFDKFIQERQLNKINRENEEKSNAKKGLPIQSSEDYLKI